MLKNLLKKIRDKPRDTLPVERAKFADPLDNPERQEASGADSGSVRSLDPEVENERNRQYKKDLEPQAYAVRVKIADNLSPRNDIRNFTVLGRLGFGGFGEVFKVKYHGDQNLYALKVLPKRELDRRKAVHFAIREKIIMNALDFEFILPLHYAFKDARNLYLVMDYACFGDMSKILKFKLSEKGVKFMIVQCILGIEYLHACNIAHRDIKPDNVLIFEDGYIKISDFGLSKRLKKKRTFSCVGTTPYMAPEILRQKGYTKGVDWWAMGILLFRMIYTGHPFAPFKCSRYQLLRCIIDGGITFPKVVYPDSSVNSFISALLEENPNERLGMLKGGADDIKKHEWFYDICFTEVLNKTTTILPWRAEVECEPYSASSFLPLEGETDYKPALFEDF